MGAGRDRDRHASFGDWCRRSDAVVVIGERARRIAAGATDSNESRAVARNIERDPALLSAEILRVPEVAHVVRAREAEIGPRRANRRRRSRAIEERDGDRAVGERPCPDLTRAVDRALAY